MKTIYTPNRTEDSNHTPKSGEQKIETEKQTKNETNMSHTGLVKSYECGKSTNYRNLMT